MGHLCACLQICPGAELLRRRRLHHASLFQQIGGNLFVWALSRCLLLGTSGQVRRGLPLKLQSLLGLIPNQGGVLKTGVLLLGREMLNAWRRMNRWTVCVGPALTEDFRTTYTSEGPLGSSFAVERLVFNIAQRVFLIS